MIFCGQCGLQLAPGTTRCPRCNAVVDETATQQGELHVDDPTVASPSLLGRSQAPQPPQAPQTAQVPGSSGQSGAPQPLILRPHAGENNYSSQAAYDATRMIDAPTHGTQVPQQNMGASYAGNFPPQSGGNYQAQTGYPDYGTHGAGSYAGAPMAMGMSYAQQPGASQYGMEPASQGNRLRVAGLIFILIGILFILSAVVLFALHQNGVLA